MIFSLLLMGAAEASCRLFQNFVEGGAEVRLEAVSEPLSCRRVTLRVSEGTVEVDARLNGRKVRKRDIATLEDGSLAIGLPELAPGGSAEIKVKHVGELEVLLGEPPPRRTGAQETHVVWTVALDPKHPGWGFADPTLGSTTKVVSTLSPDGRQEWTVGGAPAQGFLILEPGSFTLRIPGASVVGIGSEGVTVSRKSGELRFDAPAGGEARWRVVSALGDEVIPDGRTFESGLDWRFAQVSLPEPAIPVSLIGATGEALAQALYREAQGLASGWLPGLEPLRPRQLNRAWRSGWATDVERALILHRMLAQGRITAAWVLTGEEAEPMTLTGYDRMLVAARVGERDVLLDPACPVCAYDEVSVGLAGQPAVGAAELVPLSPGALRRQLRLAGDAFEGSVVLEGAAALWLRELAYGMSESTRDERWAAAMGFPGGKVVSVTGLDELGAPMTLSLSGRTPPAPVCADRVRWDGPCGDE